MEKQEQLNWFISGNFKLKKTFTVDRVNDRRMRNFVENNRFHRYQLCVFIVFNLLDAGCGPVIENTIRSLGYPNNYPNNTDCVSSVSIPQGMVINITINELYLEDSISCKKVLIFGVLTSC